MTLIISPDLSFPVDAVTQTFAILAKRGAGKSNAAVVLAEQMYDAGLPWVAIDPKGDWWGIRSSRDGKGAGLPVLVFGGQHGDVPLEPTAGKLVADLVAEQRLTCVVDVSLMSKGDERRFLADFAERLYLRNTEPLHVFAEEAHDYIPQRVTAGDARMVGAWEKLVKWGRTHGIGVTLITQRSASLNKNVLTQVETLIAMRTTGPQDQAQVRAWVDEHDSGAAMIAQLRKLDDGEAYVLSPQWLGFDEPRRIKFARRRTFDSGATPKAGQKSVQPRTVADVDLAAIKEAMAETIEKAKAEDPAELRKVIARLRQEVAEWEAHECDMVEVEPEVIEVPVLDPAYAEQLDALLEPVRDTLSYLGGALSVLATDPPKVREDIARSGRRVDPAPVPSPRSRNRRSEVPSPLSTGDSVRPTVPSDGSLPKAQRAILEVLAHGPRSKANVATLTGYSARGGGFNNALGALRSAGYVEGRDDLSITDAGAVAVGPVPPLPTGAALLEHWKNHQAIGKAGALILDALADFAPDPVDKEALAAETGYAASGGGFNNALGRLRALGLVHGTGGNPILLDEDLWL